MGLAVHRRQFVLLQSFRMDKNCELPGHMRYKYVCVWPYGSQPAPRFEVNNQLAPPPKRQLYHTVCATTIGRWADSLEWHRVACASGTVLSKFELTRAGCDADAMSARTDGEPMHYRYACTPV